MVLSKQWILWLEVTIHLLFWAILIPFQETNVVVERVGAESQQYNLNALRYWTYGVSALLFYGNIIVLSRYYYRGAYWKYILYLGLYALLILSFEYLLLNRLFGIHFKFHLAGAAINHFVFLLFSIVYVMIRGQVRAGHYLRRQKQEQLVQELAFLKSQVNPHFLFNTINNIFSIAQKNKDDEVAQYLADLSKIMRYSLYESNDLTVPLSKEINFLQSYVKMSMLKFSEDDLKLSFSIDGSAENKHIAPLLLIALVENAFKHGPIPGIPSSIDIELNTGHDHIRIKVANSHPGKALNQNSEVGGIGLNNLRRRLELLYSDRFDFDVTDKGNSFEVRLKIPLNEKHTESYSS